MRPNLVIELGTSGGGSAAFYLCPRHEGIQSQGAAAHDRSRFGVHTYTLTFVICVIISSSCLLLKITVATIRSQGKTNGIPLKQWNDPKVRTFCPHCRHATETKAWASGQIQFLRALPSDPVVLSTVEALVAESEVVFIVEESNHLTEVRNACS